MRRVLMGIVVLLVVSCAHAQADDYWKGWCDGRLAGLRQAREAMAVIREQTLHSEEWMPGIQFPEAWQEAFAYFFRVNPLTEFGTHNATDPFVITLPDGAQFVCPSGEQRRLASPERQG